jgi:hypothetical protein
MERMRAAVRKNHVTNAARKILWQRGTETITLAPRGLRTLVLYGRGWFVLLARRRWEKITAERLAEALCFMQGHPDSRRSLLGPLVATSQRVLANRARRHPISPIKHHSSPSGRVKPTLGSSPARCARSTTDSRPRAAPSPTRPRSSAPTATRAFERVDSSQTPRPRHQRCSQVVSARRAARGGSQLGLDVARLISSPRALSARSSSTPSSSSTGVAISRSTRCANSSPPSRTPRFPFSRSPSNLA